MSVTPFFPPLVTPAFAEPTVPTALTIQDVTSKQGIEAWLIEDTYLPIVSLEFAVEGGSAFDPKGKKGLALLTMHLLDEGAGAFSSQEFHEQLEEHNVSLSFWASKDWLRGSLKVLKKDLKKALELFVLATTKPNFDKDSIERLKKQKRATIRSRQEDPASLAQLGWFERAFPEHPYGVPVIGTEADLANITRTDIQAYFADAFNREALTVAAAGDITPEELGDVLDTLFGGWQKTTTRRLADIKKPALPEPTLHVIDTDIPQTTVYFGRKGVARNDPDFYAYHLMNYIFGQGSFSSRLMEEIREKRGLAYGVSTFSWDGYAVPLLQGRLATSNERVHESIDILRRETQKMATKKVSQDELDDAKTYVINSLYLNLVRTSSLAGFALNLQLDDIAKDYPQKRQVLFENVTLEDIQRVARDVLEGQWLIIAVGKPEL
ncbi:MAG: insulinase family protein [Alphaproteobacteria bacterium GM202ARS2]|nr:insulinase family protein [Alphaproteobacteria bacterium GM202ARS2]